MSTIAENLTRIQQAKADIKTAIEAKGVSVPSSATIDTYDDYVSQISGGGSGLEMPSAFTEWVYDDYGKTISATIKSGITNVPNYLFYGQPLENVVVPNTVTSVGDYSFANQLLSKTTNSKSLKLSNIDFSNVTNVGGYVFSKSVLTGDLYLKLSGTTTGSSSKYSNMFEESIIDSGCTITVNADNSIIPISIFKISSNSTSYPIDGGKVIINGQPTTLATKAFRGGYISRKTYFTSASAVTATSYTSYNLPFETGTVYVPSDYLSGWQNLYTATTFKPIEWVSVSAGETIPSGMIFGVNASATAVKAYGSEFNIGDSNRYITLVGQNTRAGETNYADIYMHYDNNDYSMTNYEGSVFFIFGNFHTTFRQPSYVVEDGTRVAPFNLLVYMPQD